MSLQYPKCDFQPVDSPLVNCDLSCSLQGGTLGRRLVFTLPGWAGTPACWSPPPWSACWSSSMVFSLWTPAKSGVLFTLHSSHFKNSVSSTCSIFFFAFYLTILILHFSKEICEANTTMCPMCEDTCEPWTLSDSCVYAKVSVALRLASSNRVFCHGCGLQTMPWVEFIFNMHF